MTQRLAYYTLVPATKSQALVVAIYYRVRSFAPSQRREKQHCAEPCNLSDDRPNTNTPSLQEESTGR